MVTPWNKNRERIILGLPADVLSVLDKQKICNCPCYYFLTHIRLQFLISLLKDESEDLAKMQHILDLKN